MSAAKRPPRSFTLFSPAKLNLALQITGRGADGFHLLNTVFERISLADGLFFSPAEDSVIQLTCTNPAVPCDERNLVYKAAMAIREFTGVAKGARVHISKNIPVAAGLAGGSSNAATALLGFNRLWNLKLSRTVLLKLARQLGSDVAFFLYDTPFALGTGRGDKIRVLAVKPKFWHVLITAKQPLLTKEVYGVYAEKFLNARVSGRKANGCLSGVMPPLQSYSTGGFTTKRGDVSMLVRSLKVNDVPGAQRCLFNDLEGPIGVLRPGLLALKARIQQQAGAGVCFSGSGPSIFALTAGQAEAEGIASAFRKKYKQVFVVHTA
ncbi:MAG: 4-(cytidine 5'-diphospho)-2-C-methyl-D-erythritol kinase [Candidatus Omnitrophica bacterium]|nr:4-(cytidine 5'-diphospho)-2-C-methyl-D-erythritol kinase [Candidatus Omnitrophota bacterium]